MWGEAVRFGGIETIGESEPDMSDTDVDTEEPDIGVSQEVAVVEYALDQVQDVQAGNNSAYK